MSETKIKEIMNHYGFESQIEIFIEECAEAIQAAQKMKRSNSTETAEKAFENFIEEIADVIITAAQMRLYIGETTIDAAIDRKLERQLLRIANETQEEEQ